MKRLNIIIVAEGAIDRSNRPITTDYIKDVSTELCVGKWAEPAWSASCVTSVLLPWRGCDSVAVFLEHCAISTLVWRDGCHHATTTTAAQTSSGGPH